MSKLKKLTLSFNKRQYFIATIVVLLLAFVLRFYKLGVVPHGMTWDEAAIGYNGYSILTTRRDEWLSRLPISFWSFGDWKAPLAIYINGFFTAVFGMNAFAVRLPFAITSILAIWGMMRLTNILLKSRFWAIVGGLFLTLSPWHFHFSRTGFESGLSLAMVIWGSYFFLKALEVKEKRRVRIDFLLAVMALVASVYAYHSNKIFSPLLALIWLLFFWKKVWKKKQAYLMSVVVGVLTLVPFVYDSVVLQGLTRAGTLIFAEGHGFWETLVVFYNNILAHLTLSFWIFGEVTVMRHGDGKWGILLVTTFVLMLASFFKKKKGLPFYFALAWVMAGFLPAVLGIEVPHGNRSLSALPGLIWMAIFGLQTILVLIKDAAWKQIFLGGCVLLHSLLFVSYLSDYYNEFDANSAEAFQDGYIEAFNYVIPYEKGLDGKREVEKIIFTSDYGQPYIFALFTRKTNPIEYHGGSLIKYEFKDEITLGDLERPNSIVVASATDQLFGKNDKADHVIYDKGGKVRFRIYFTYGDKE